MGELPPFMFNFQHLRNPNLMVEFSPILYTAKIKRENILPIQIWTGLII